VSSSLEGNHEISRVVYRTAERMFHDLNPFSFKNTFITLEDWGFALSYAMCIYPLIELNLRAPSKITSKRILWMSMPRHWSSGRNIGINASSQRVENNQNFLKEVVLISGER